MVAVYGFYKIKNYSLTLFIKTNIIFAIISALTKFLKNKGGSLYV